MKLTGLKPSVNLLKPFFQVRDEQYVPYCPRNQIASDDTGKPARTPWQDGIIAWQERDGLLMIRGGHGEQLFYRGDINYGTTATVRPSSTPDSQRTRHVIRIPENQKTPGTFPVNKEPPPTPATIKT